MASQITGYSYDIFISYRHNDNLDGWVSDFVESLEKELRRTLKDPVSIYFDKNPFDGLLENHNVDKSLEGKLKCLIFIPVLSQTYCDPKSFAWQYEFCSFNQLAETDELGRDIELSNGNVSSRILPVKIHELDDEDKQAIEKEINGVLRAIDFTYKEAGVNRPLTIGDNKQDNQNKTDYRNQINKVANAIKEIMGAIKNPKSSEGTSTKIQEKAPGIKRNKKSFWFLIILAILSLGGYYLYNVFFKEVDSIKNTEKTIAVLPFQDMSPGGDQEYFSDGIAAELINALSKQPGLRVTGRTSSFFYKEKEKTLKTIGEELGVEAILEGSVQKSGNTLRISAQLTNVEDGFQIWGESFDRELTDIFKVQDEITLAILKGLKVHLGGKAKTVAKEIETNLNAYEIYLLAREKLAKRGNHIYEAIELFEKVIILDSNYAPAFSGLARAYALLPPYFPESVNEVKEKARKAANKAIELNPESAEAYSVMGTVIAFYDWKFNEAESYFNKSYELNPNDAEILNFLGDYYTNTGNIKGIETELKAYQQNPLHPVQSNDVAVVYNMYGEYSKSIDFAKRAIKLDSGLTKPYLNLFNSHYMQGNFLEAERAVKNYPVTDTFSFLELQETLAYADIQLNRIDSAKKKVKKLEEACTNGNYFASNIGYLWFLLGDENKASEWLKIGIDRREFSIINGFPFVLLPEEYPENSLFRKAMNAPELEEFFALRRKNFILMDRSYLTRSEVLLK